LPGFSRSCTKSFETDGKPERTKLAEDLEEIALPRQRVSVAEIKNASLSWLSRRQSLDH
jgi:hypothetical protein